MILFFKKKSFRNTTKVLNSLDPGFIASPPKKLKILPSAVFHCKQLIHFNLHAISLDPDFFNYYFQGNHQCLQI